MPARSTHVIFKNNTPFLLSRTDGGLDHGVFTEPFNFVDRIAPGATADWETESDGVMTGTEGFVNYRIGDGPAALHIHWDNPFISNFDRGNTYHEFVSDGFELFHTGGAGNNTVVNFTLAFSVPHRVRQFLPSTSGFQFSNNAWKDMNVKLPVVELPPPFDGAKITDTSQGMCGGIIFATRDYYESGLVPPPNTQPPTSQNDPLFQYLRDRLFASWDVTRTGHDYFVFMDPAYPDTDANFLSSLGAAEGRAFAMTVDEWPEVKNEIDNGILSPIGLIRVKSLLPTDLGQNHQVLVHGYELDGGKVRLHIYDPNHPGKDTVVLAFNKDRTDVPILVSYTIDGEEDGKPVYCFFRINYEHRDPLGGQPKGSSKYNVSLRQFYLTSGFDSTKGLRALRPGAHGFGLKSVVGL